MSRSLIFPDLIEKEGLVSWLKGVESLIAKSPALRDQFYARFGASIEPGANSNQLLDLSLPAHRMALAAMGAARSRDLAVFVATSRPGQFRELRPEVWAPSHDALVHPLHLALHGRLLVVTGLLLFGSPEAEVAGRCLYVDERQLSRLLAPRRISVAALSGTARSIVAEHQKTQPEVALKRDQFMMLLRNLHPAVTSRQGRLAWKEAAPAEWRKAGRKR